MPKERRRRRRYKASNKHEKHWRKSKFTESHEFDFKTGLSHGAHDLCRAGFYGPLDHARESLKDTSRNISRCPLDCRICHGREPGCMGGERTAKNHRKYQQSIAYVEEQLRQDNAKYWRYIEYFRTFASLYYLRTFTLSFGHPTEVFFSLYDQSVPVQIDPWYPVKSVAFQNQLSSFPFLTWKREMRCIVLSPKQKKSLMCLGASTKLLVKRLVPYYDLSVNQYNYLRYNILRRLFGKKSIRRLLIQKSMDCGCCTKAYLR